MAQRRNEDFLDAQGNLVLERRHVDFTGTASFCSQLAISRLT
jgi:hypothetical protein